MNLENYTIQIQNYSRVTVNNFFKIGNLLKEVKDKEIYKEKYSNFENYLDGEDFQFHRTWAFYIIKIVEDPKLVQATEQIGISKICELLAVPDREIREEIIEKAVTDRLTLKQVRAEVKQTNIERLSRNISDEVKEGDIAVLKVERQGEAILKEILGLKSLVKYNMSNIQISLEKWLLISVKYPSEKVKNLKGAILLAFKELKEATEGAPSTP